MAGHMGDRRVTERNLKVLDVDSARHLLLVKGAVPGSKKGLLLIKKAGGGKQSASSDS
jgi:large subunit ribosomal protein L3